MEAILAVTLCFAVFGGGFAFMFFIAVKMAKWIRRKEGEARRKEIEWEERIRQDVRNKYNKK